jgi:hypothetical protein
MEENKEQIDIMEYMPEKFENIPSINKENMFDKEKEYELNQNLKELDFISDSLKEKEKEKSKGYTRIFRNIIKKKSEIMKNILKKRLTKWRKEAVKGLIVKKTIIVRISVSREKDYKDRYKNKLRLDKENEKEKSKSTNKNVIKSHNFIQPEINSYNIVREKIDNIDNQQDNTKENLNIDNIVNNENTDIQIDNITNNFTIEKNNTININNEDNILKDNEKDNESNKDISNENLKMKKNKLINISNEKPKNTAQIYNIYATNTKPDSTNNINNKFTKVNNITLISRTYNKNDKQKIQESNKKNENNLNKNQKYNASNVAIISSSYTTKNNKNNKEQKETTKNNALINKNEMKGYYIKYDGFHENKNIYSSIPIPVKTVNLNEKEYNPYRNNNYNKISSIRNAPDNKNKSDINLYSRRTYQLNNNKNINNNNISSISNISNIEKYNNYTSRPGNYSSIRQKLNTIENTNLRGGVTTVIQHYGGRRKQYENYNQKSFKKTK